MSWIKRALGRREPVNIRPTLVRSLDETVFYAVGDIHGCLDLLVDLIGKIKRDAAHLEREFALVLLGDLVDRGPNSAQVLDYAIELTRQAGAICLAGNHEVSMLEFIDHPEPRSSWLKQGGIETLQSYDIDVQDEPRKWARRSMLDTFIPRDHVEFLRGLPKALRLENYFLSHAGPDPNKGLEEQTEEDLLWRKDGMQSDYANFGAVVVHGHEAQDRVSIGGHRINVDTGAYATGRLSAVRLMHGAPPITLTSERGGSRTRLDV